MILDNWVDENKPNGLAKLSIQAGLSTSTLEKVRIGDIPSKQQTRLRICKALGVSEEELFPMTVDLKTS